MPDDIEQRLATLGAPSRPAPASSSPTVLTCPWCGGKRKLIARVPFETIHRIVSIPLRGNGAYLTDGKVGRAILEHLGLPTAAPVLAPARSPPELDFAG